jgi:ferredoxin-type protein NapF
VALADMDTQRRLILRGRWAEARSAATQAPRRPPWALRPDDRFLEACTRCGRCVQACPPRVLAAGAGGFPVIDFAKSGCTLCGNCRDVCDAGALARDAQAIAFAWRAEVGPACLARRAIECRICGDACEVRALHFPARAGGVAQPQVEPAACTGCGACVPVCPTAAIDLR